MLAFLAFAQKLKQRLIKSLLDLIAKKNNFIYINII
jgi:hypothetical protein